MHLSHNQSLSIYFQFTHFRWKHPIQLTHNMLFWLHELDRNTKSWSKQGVPVSAELAGLSQKKISYGNTSVEPFILEYINITCSIQVVHLIQGWMEEKLQTYFKRDTECLNHNTWMISCMLIPCCCCFHDGLYRTVVFVLLLFEVYHFELISVD